MSNVIQVFLNVLNVLLIAVIYTVAATATLQGFDVSVFPIGKQNLGILLIVFCLTPFLLSLLMRFIYHRIISASAY